MLASRWYCGKDTSNLALKHTYQEYTRASENLSSWYKTRCGHLRYHHLTGPYSRIYIGTYFSKIKSIRGNNCAQLFYNKVNFFKVYPLRRQEDCHMTIQLFLDLVGITEHMHMDQSPDLINSHFGSILQNYRIK